MSRNDVWTVVAIDGPAGVGKSTVAHGVASALGYRLIDTGALYRVVALLARKTGIGWQDDTALAGIIPRHAFEFDSDGKLAVDGQSVEPAIRTPEMSRGASLVASMPGVRGALLTLQRQLGSRGGIVMEGRDIGTVVFPNAKAKFFLFATPAVRAHRRFLELRDRGEQVTLAEITAQQQERDAQDSTRNLAPLRRAEDAIEIDCDTRLAAQVVELILNHIRGIAE